MLRKRLISVVSALIVLGVAACGGGGTTGPTVTYPNPGTGQSGTLNIASAGGVNATAAVSGTGTFAATGSTSPQGGLAAIGSGSTSVFYFSITAENGPATLTFVSGASVNTGSAPAAGTYYLAYWSGTVWTTLKATPGTISGNVITVSGAAIPAGLQALANGASDYFVVYSGGIVPPTPTPSPTPVATPTPNAITNGTFETGSLAPWTACSYAHQPYAAAVNPSPAPAATASQPPISVGSPSPVLTGAALTPYASVTAAPSNYNPNHTSSTPTNLGTKSALVGSLNSQINAATGICQVVTVPTTGQLTFWVYEGGTAYNFYNGDQEAQILDSTGTTIKQTLFVELNCYYDSTNFPTSPVYAGSGCFPTAYGGTSAYVDWQGGFWTQRGPYDLTALAGQTVTLFIGVWTDQTRAGPASYANYMFVDNASLVQ